MNVPDLPSLDLDRRIQTVCLMVLSAIAVGAALNWLSPVLVPFVLAVFFSYCLTPVIELLMKHLRIPRYVAIGVAVLLGCVILALLWLLVSASVAQMAANSQVYSQQINLLLEKTAQMLPLERFGVKKDDLTQSVIEYAQSSVGTIAKGMIGSIANILSNGMLVGIFMIFMLLGRSPGQRPTDSLLSVVESRIKSYVLTMVFVSGTTGVLVGLTLATLGVEFAWVFGFLAFLFNFIPNIGSVIATLLPVPVALLNPELSVTVKVLVVVIPAGIQFVVGNLIQPKLMGQSLDLHPVTVLISLIFFGMIWGVIGMFLATPITAVMKILLGRMQLTVPVAALLAGRLDNLSSPSSP